MLTLHIGPTASAMQRGLLGRHRGAGNGCQPCADDLCATRDLPADRAQAPGPGAGYPIRIFGGKSPVLLVVSVAYATVVLLIPDALGMHLFADTWTGASPMLLPLAVCSTLGAADMGPAIIIYPCQRVLRLLDQRARAMAPRLVRDGRGLRAGPTRTPHAATCATGPTDLVLVVRHREVIAGQRPAEVEDDLSPVDDPVEPAVRPAGHRARTAGRPRRAHLAGGARAAWPSCPPPGRAGSSPSQTVPLRRSCPGLPTDAGRPGGSHHPRFQPPPSVTRATTTPTPD